MFINNSSFFNVKMKQDNITYRQLVNSVRNGVLSTIDEIASHPPRRDFEASFPYHDPQATDDIHDEHCVLGSNRYKGTAILLPENIAVFAYQTSGYGAEDMPIEFKRDEVEGVAVKDILFHKRDPLDQTLTNRISEIEEEDLAEVAVTVTTKSNKNYARLTKRGTLELGSGIDKEFGRYVVEVGEVRFRFTAVDYAVGKILVQLFK